ncbi:hypothetical protein LPN04_01360 [Rugamonas sp. A1-17]|nr:hypothetical protein [Rugamonas sp. A1-17]
MACTINRRSIGMNPLRSARDWAILAGIVALLFAEVLLLEWWQPSGVFSAVVIGGLIGMAPSVFSSLPVRGTVKATGRIAFLGRVEQAGFVLAGEGPEGRIYKSKGPRWLSWDSNRIIIGATDGDEIPVTVPLHFYISLKRRQL